MYDREKLRRALALYAVTDSTWLRGRSLSDCVAQAVCGRVTFMQLRQKDASRDELMRLAAQLLPLARAAHIPFVMNDEVELACAVGADGVHVGQDDMACAQARAAMGSNAIVGVSAHTVEQAQSAQAAGADYLGVGALFPSSTKSDAICIGVEGLRKICSAVDIPVVAIGGLNKQTIGHLKGCGADGVAVVSALFAADDIGAASEELWACVQATLAIGALHEGSTEHSGF